MTIEELRQQNEAKIIDHICSIRKLKHNVLSSIQTISMRIDAANQANKRMSIQLRVNFSLYIAACGYMRTKIYT